MNDSDFWQTIRRAILMAESKDAIPVDLRPSALMIAAAIEKRYAPDPPPPVYSEPPRRGLTANLPPLRGLSGDYDR